MSQLPPTSAKPSSAAESRLPSPGQSYRRTITRFSSSLVAKAYPRDYGISFRQWREAACIRRTLRFLPAKSKVLDLPCGTGRLLPLLGEAGFQITAADVSPHALAIAQSRWHTQASLSHRIEFTVREALDTGFEDQTFDGIICNRLFHHFNEPETRVAVLSELRRICRGPLVVSFFNSFALDALKFRLKHRVRRTKPKDRIPIPLRRFQSEVEEAGLRILARFAVLWGLSPLWYLVPERQEP